MERIHWVTSACFNAIAELSRLQAEEVTDPALVYARMRALVTDLVGRGRSAGYSDEDVSLIAYALVALADEVMMASPGPLRELWTAKPLQVAFFCESVAGERFFEILARVRESPQQRDVLRTYYLCLLFGFRGRYALPGAEAALDALTEDVRARLARALPMPEQLAPDAAQPVTRRDERRHGGTGLTLGLGALALACVLHLALLLSLREELGGLIRQLTASVAG